MKIYQVTMNNNTKYFADKTQAMCYMIADIDNLVGTEFITIDMDKVEDRPDSERLPVESFKNPYTMTFADYVLWDGSFYNNDKDECIKLERETLRKMDDDEHEFYFNAIGEFVYDECTPARLVALLNLMSKYNLSMYTAMVAY